MRLGQLSALLGSVFALAISAGSAQAQATRTWVSGVGDDANPCSRTAPCKTFAGAISKTAVNGEINCLDPAGYGAVTITKSMTIDCGYTNGSILNSGTQGVIVNFNSFQVTDLRKTVRLRGLTMNGANTGVGGVRIIGGTVTGGNVFVEDTVIDGNFAGLQRGINDERTGGGKLFISNTTVRNNGAAGIVVIGSATRIDVSIDNVRSENNSAGVAINNNTKATITNSVFSGNAGVGVDAEGSGALVVLDRSASSSNGIGLFTSGGGAIRVSGSTIAANTTAASGAWTSFGDNKVTDNGAAGTAPTAAGGPTSNLGQQ